LTELVQRSRREAAPVASELLASLRESAPAASKTSPLGPGPIRSKLARAAEEASAAVRPTASLGAELSPPPPDAAELQSGYHIQVASLRVKETADELAASLRKQGFRARSDPYGFSKADWWHVVRIGPFQTRVAAEGRRLQLGPVQRATAVVLPRARGKHHVQIASLQSNEQAIQLLERLQQRGHSARITTVGETGQGRWHCVRIGPFDSRQEAEDYRALLKAREDIDSQVVPFAPSE
jgi:cell division septation protein DedD